MKTISYAITRNELHVFNNESQFNYWTSSLPLNEITKQGESFCNVKVTSANMSCLAEMIFNDLSEYVIFDIVIHCNLRSINS